MARRKKGGGVGLIAQAPWPVGFVLGIVSFAVVRYGLGIFLAGSTNSYLAAIGQQMSHGAFTLIAWGLLAFCWIGALVSFFKDRATKNGTYSGSSRVMAVRQRGAYGGQGKQGDGIRRMAMAPWPALVALGVLLFGTVRYGLGLFLADSSNSYLAAIGHQLFNGAFTLIAWGLLAFCWIAAIVSFFKGRSRRILLDTRSGLDSLKAIDWRQFEMLVGEAFRRQGYTIAETGLGGADGGIDLVLHKHSNVIIVQCKQWRRKSVDVRVVREMYGLMAHHKAQSAKIVCVGDFTADAKQFVQGKPIELITGEKLLTMIRDAQGHQDGGGEDSPIRRAISVDPAPPRWVPGAFETSPVRLAKRLTPAVARVPKIIELSPVRAVKQTQAAAASAAKASDIPSCPHCGSTMIERVNRRTKELFWGCANYPKCRGMRARAPDATSDTMPGVSGQEAPVV